MKSIQLGNNGILRFSPLRVKNLAVIAQQYQTHPGFTGKITRVSKKSHLVRLSAFAMVFVIAVFALVCFATPIVGKEHMRDSSVPPQVEVWLGKPLAKMKGQ